jgi:hypothetical protein
LAIQGLMSGAERIQTSCLDVTPAPICTSYQAYPDLIPNLVLFVVALAVFIACWKLGARKRAVWIDGDGSVRIVWGDTWLPVNIRRYPAGSLGTCVITHEKRFTLTPRIGSSATSVRRAPDRWRIRAPFGKRTVNLGSYASEAEAHRVVRIIGSRPEDIDGVWHYGRLN